ncbi:MAG: hypothetical protein K2X80_19515 [Pseudomonadaceae bacterium]|nr:hypothetical protein [Pseudomonadaceae bacterium]
MSQRFYIGSPLTIEDFEIVEHLEQFALYVAFDGAADLIDDALSLLHQGHERWQKQKSKSGEWLPTAVDAVAAVRRHASNIRQRFQRCDDLAESVRWSIGYSATEKITGAQYAAAFSLHHTCRAIEVLGRWFADFDTDLYAPDPKLIGSVALESPEDFEALVDELRKEGSRAETEARADVVKLLSDARYYLQLADAINKPGRQSAEVKADDVKARNLRICKAASRLLNGGTLAKDVVGKVHGASTAELGSGREKLSQKQLRRIMRAGGVPI